MNSYNYTPDESMALRPPARLLAVAALSVVIGVLGLAIGFRIMPRDTWVWLLVNFVFFAGVAHGAFVWSAVFRVAQARWTPAINRMGHSMLAYVPVLLIALVALLSGVREYVPWVRHVRGDEARA